MTDQTTERRGGAHRSVEILHELDGARLAATGQQRAGRAVSELTWQPAQAYAIQRDSFRDVWHAGHVSALVSNGVDVVAAGQTGGVWLLTSVTAPSPLGGYTGTSLSDPWDAPDVSCLAFGPGSSEVFAGTSASVLMLLEFGTALGGHLTHLRTTSLPVPFSSTRSVVTMPDPRRIVVMTSSGVWWSPLPVPASNAAGYDWQEADGLEGGSYTGLAVGPDQSVTVAHSGGQVAIGIGTPLAPTPAGFFRGTFDFGALTFVEARVKGLDLILMGRISLASCDDQRSRMYAVAERTGSGTILGVLASSDGGTTWGSTGSPDTAKAGLRGFYNNAIVVSPQRPDVVVIGWLSGGPFWSFDGGASWEQLHNQETNPHLHNDVHAVFLGRSGAGREPLYVGGDGGVVVSEDLGRTYHSQFNRPLNDLQFYGGARASVVGSYGGSLTASSRYPGLLAGGTQDNGNIYRCPDRTRVGVPRQADMSWFRHVGGDGDLNRFVDPLGVLLNFDNTNIKLGMAVWDEDAQRFPQGPGTVIAADDKPGGVAPTAVEVVTTPSYRRNGKLVFATVGSLPTGDVHGLVAADPRGEKPDARDVSLIRFGTVGAPVSALGSYDGSTIMIGTTTGRILSLDSDPGIITEYALPDVADGVVSRIEVFPAPTRLGALPDNAYALVGDGIFHFNGLYWSATAGTGWTTFAYDRSTDRLFGATDADVFASDDHGRSWVDASVGLPARPHCADLRIAADGRGGLDLYLSTYGRSVWRTTIARRPNILELPPQAVEVLVGVLEDGGGLVRLGKRIFKIPPRPLIRDILAALVIEDVAQEISGSSAASSAQIRATALRQIAEIANRAADGLG
jgi:hypothetical protein